MRAFHSPSADRHRLSDKNSDAEGACPSSLPDKGMLESCGAGLLVCLPFYVREEAQSFAAWTSKAMASQVGCSDETDLECRNAGLAFHLKLAAIVTVLFAGAVGVALPLLGRKLTAFKTDGPYFVVAKAFAAGVILATGFVHMLPDAMEALTDSCLPQFPWRQFPFSGCIAMLAALGTLMVDVLGTEYYERKHAKEEQAQGVDPPMEWAEVPSSFGEVGVEKDTHSSGHIDTDHMHIVGMRAHAASHTHSHPHGHHSCADISNHGHLHKNFEHSETTTSTAEDVSTHVRHVVVSQVLELGIVTHSIIIGISLGVSQSPCTIRPLFAALSFHQFFEGFALGGCISQAGFKSFSTMAMTVCFTMTTPLGIGVGTGISSGYNSNSQGALIVEGIFDSVSAGILIYMALVDLIAADFLSKRMCCNRLLQALSYASLFLGAATMSALAVWA